MIEQSKIGCIYAMKENKMTRQIAPSPLRTKPFGGLDAMTLRLLALGLMLLDHMWATVVSGNMWRTYVGRLAFPIFAFQVTEGFFYTSDCNVFFCEYKHLF